ncbi:MAG: helix-hairpin-helix domain-containing protein [Phycisphaerales bacterium]
MTPRASPPAHQPSSARGTATGLSLSSLASLANVGPATLADFHLLGIRSVRDLARRDPIRLYRRLCARTKCHQDPCVIDVFMATIAQARGGPPTPWWRFTPERKRLLAGTGGITPTRGESFARGRRVGASPRAKARAHQPEDSFARPHSSSASTS